MNDTFMAVPVVYRKLPGRVRGFCCLGSDFEPIIVINQDLSREQQRKTYQHEMNHILSGEMDMDDYVEYKESV